MIKWFLAGSCFKFKSKLKHTKGMVLLLCSQCVDTLPFASKHAKGMSRFSGKFLGIDYAMLPNCEWNQKQKHKKQPWSNVECFAFGVGIVRFASLETSFHAANHTIPPPPSYEGSPHCPKDKNRSPFHGEKPLMIT